MIGVWCSAHTPLSGHWSLVGRGAQYLALPEEQPMHSAWTGCPPPGWRGNVPGERREIKGLRDHGYNGAEKWVRGESVDRRKEERGRGKEGEEKEGEGEYRYSKSDVTVIIGKRGVSPY